MKKVIVAAGAAFIGSLMLTSCSPKPATSWDDVVGEDSLEFVVNVYDTTHDIGRKVRFMGEEEQQILFNQLPFDTVQETLNEAVLRLRMQSKWPKTFIFDGSMSFFIDTPDELVKEEVERHEERMEYLQSEFDRYKKEYEKYKAKDPRYWSDFAERKEKRLEDTKGDLEEEKERHIQELKDIEIRGGKVRIFVSGTASNAYGVPGIIMDSFTLEELSVDPWIGDDIELPGADDLGF